MYANRTVTRPGARRPTGSEDGAATGREFHGELVVPEHIWSADTPGEKIREIWGAIQASARMVDSLF
jgi:hypothetical protein